MEKQQKTDQDNDKFIEEVVENEGVEVVEETEEKVIEDLDRKIEALQDKLLRQLAESENIRTRSAKLIEESKEYAIFDFTKDLMPVMDNLQRALEHLPENLDSEAQNVVEGVKMTKSQLEYAFEKHNLESISPQAGDKFDYNKHHAISQVITEEFDVGSIVNTMQVGYLIKDRLIRPASVVVAKSPDTK